MGKSVPTPEAIASRREAVGALIPEQIKQQMPATHAGCKLCSQDNFLQSIRRGWERQAMAELEHTSPAYVMNFPTELLAEDIVQRIGALAGILPPPDDITADIIERRNKAAAASAR